MAHSEIDFHYQPPETPPVTTAATLEDWHRLLQYIDTGIDQDLELTEEEFADRVRQAWLGQLTAEHRFYGYGAEAVDLIRTMSTGQAARERFLSSS